MLAPLVLRMPGWPAGFCPLHYGEGMECWAGCWPVRVEFAKVARELDAYFRSPMTLHRLRLEAERHAG